MSYESEADLLISSVIQRMGLLRDIARLKASVEDAFRAGYWTGHGHGSNGVDDIEEAMKDWRHDMELLEKQSLCADHCVKLSENNHGCSA
mgnify:CR=1 FL=1